MRLYRHSKVTSAEQTIPQDAWVNRITCEDPPQEIWIVWLPSYGMEYSLVLDEHVWSQRGWFLNARTGEHGKASKPVARR